MQLSKLISAQEAADALGIALRTLYNRTQRKAERPFPIRPIRVGRKLLFKTEDIQKFIENGGE